MDHALRVNWLEEKKISSLLQFTNKKRLCFISSCYLLIKKAGAAHISGKLHLAYCLPNLPVGKRLLISLDVGALVGLKIRSLELKLGDLLSLVHGKCPLFY